jgi:LEA14-like dessication related protein
MMTQKLRLPVTRLLLCFSFFMLQSCATLDPDYEEPTVTLSSFKAMPSEGMVPTFEIGLNILNPNASELRLEGIVYEVSVQGHNLVKGVGKDYPVIEGYSQQTVKLTAVANLLSGIRLLGDLMKLGDDELQYEFEAKLDTGGFFPSIRVKESGSFNLNGQGESSKTDAPTET